MIIHMMRDPSLAVAFSTQLRVILATLFGTFGLFAQAIYYLVITGTFDDSLFLLVISFCPIARDCSPNSNSRVFSPFVALRGAYQSPYLSLSILLLDEVIPALLFLACVVTLPNPKRFVATLRSASKGSGKSSGKSSGKGSSKDSGKDSESSSKQTITGGTA